MGTNDKGTKGTKGTKGKGKGDKTSAKGKGVALDMSVPETVNGRKVHANGAPTGSMSLVAAAKYILDQAPEPLSCAALVAIAAKHGLHMSSAPTPANTLYTALSRIAGIDRANPDGTGKGWVTRVGRGLWAMRQADKTKGTKGTKGKGKGKGTAKAKAS